MCKDEPVKLIVGTAPNMTTWYIHRGLLTNYSQYFRAALEKDRFAESNSNSISLPDDDSSAFEIFALWIYTVGLTGHHSFNIKLREDHCFIFVKAYCLGDKFGIPRFKNDALRALAAVNLVQLRITPESVIYAFDHTMKGSGLRAMLTDMLATSIQSGVVKLKQNTVHSQPNDSEDPNWSELFEGGGEFVSAVLNKFVGNALVSWIKNPQDHLEGDEEQRFMAGKYWALDKTYVAGSVTFGNTPSS